MAEQTNRFTLEGNTLTLPSSITAENSADLWKKAGSFIKNGSPLTVDAANLTFCDESGLALLYQMKEKTKNISLVNVSEEISQLYDVMTKGLAEVPIEKKVRLGFVSSIGKWLADFFSETGSSLVFLGSSVCAIIATHFRPSLLRFGEIFSVCDETGSRAVPIVCLIGFLMGIIIAFETALVAQIFGAVIFVVNGIGIAMTRELGPLMTAILFAGRSGSAFAAQIGTQKVSEELNALTTFGLDPVYFLVVPRLLASVLVVPLLSVFATLMGIIGGGIIMGLYDISFTQFYVQLLKSIGVSDVLFGLVKAAIFGFVIALIGCECGIHTGAGATAVGLSTTRSVVKSIIWIVIIDGVAALLSNRLGV